MPKKERVRIEQAYENWVNCLKGTDPNSIFQQITLMIWDTAIFKIIVEGRKDQIQKNPQNPEINGSLHSFIDRNYFQTQCMFIRRLADNSYGLTGDRGVYSLGALINVIKSYRAEFTRAAYLEFRNLPYDKTERLKKRNDFFGSHPPGIAFHVPSDLNVFSIDEAHQFFDRLSNTSPEHRRKEDQISENVFSRLREKLDICEGIARYVDKFIAHSATPESQTSLDEAMSKITYKRLWEAHQILFEVADFLSVVLFSVSHMALAFEHPTFFDYWGTPIVGVNDFETIHATLEKYRKETEEWSSNGFKNVWDWIEKKQPDEIDNE